MLLLQVLQMLLTLGDKCKGLLSKVILAECSNNQNTLLLQETILANSLVGLTVEPFDEKHVFI